MASGLQMRWRKIMSIEEKFFRKLSERLNKENNLSDITWALCESSEQFKNLFLEYCFDDEKIVNIDLFTREYSNLL
jgi:hypothetical protein